MAISLWDYWKSTITLETLHVILSFPIWNPKISSKFCSLALLHVTGTRCLPPFLCHSRIIDQHLSTLLGYWRWYDWKRIGTSSWVPFVLLGERAFAMVVNGAPPCGKGKPSHFQGLQGETKREICRAGRSELSKGSRPLLPCPSSLAGFSKLIGAPRHICLAGS